jgi:transposase
MIRPSADVPRVHLCREPVDMRKSIDGLAALVSHVLKQDPFSAELFVFVNRQRNKIKILAWDRSGFVILYKRLEQERFHWPKTESTATITITGQQLNWLLDGYNLTAMKPHAALPYRAIA